MYNNIFLDNIFNIFFFFYLFIVFYYIIHTVLFIYFVYVQMRLEREARLWAIRLWNPAPAQAHAKHQMKWETKKLYRT